MNHAGYTFREIGGLTTFLKVLLGLGVAMAAVSLTSSLMQASLLDRGNFTEAEGEANDARERMVGLLHLALHLFTAVVFGCWIVRANRNVWALGARGLPISPGWAVGFFFVPIVSLWMPYQAMRELWRASHHPAAWRRVTASPVLPIWWTLWILSNVLGQVSLRVALNAKDLEGLRLATWLDVVSLALDIPLCLVARALVAQIANAQQRQVEIAAESGDAPDPWDEERFQTP